MSMRRLLSPVVAAPALGALALLALLAYGVFSSGSDEGINSALARGERPAAPRVELPRLDGRGRGSLRGYRGKVVVLNYWASWCDPCREESPLLERWHRRIASRGGTVLGVDVLDVTADARAFVRRYKLSYPMLRDREGETQGSYGVNGYPETFVIDRRGRIAAARRGPVDDRFLERTLPRLLAERA
jgi:cytochrome c biogenesis protein CcmG/thiol:disulfide interchange protein DsbE